MKQVLFILALAFAVVSCKQNNVETTAKAKETTTQKSNQLSLESSKVGDALPQTTIEWSKTKHDFGNIKEGEIVKTTFTVKNTGKNPLVINKAKGSCGCTVPKVEKNVPIAPGETTEIEVQFNSNGRPGKQTKTVQLYGNFTPSPSTSTITAMVEAKAKPAVTADHKHDGTEDHSH